jgi:hypothetical protein
MEAYNGFSGMLGPGSTSFLTSPRTMPDPSTLFDYYVTNGTVIDLASLPTQGSIPAIERALLSPANNPYGPTNAQGIYVIDCASSPIYLTDSRIVGTLVLLNTGTDSQIYGSINCEPAVSNYPTLLVKGTIKFSPSGDLLEGSNPATNFNPPGTPYGGATDTDTSDTYPSLLKGLVYVSDEASTSFTPVFEGVLVVGVTMTVNGTVDLTYDSRYFSNPPPGFGGGGQMAVSPGTWNWVVD